MIATILSLTLVGTARLEAIYLAHLRSARDTATLQTSRRDYRDIRFQRKLCQMQARQALIPWGCYRMIRLELAWKILPPAAARRLTEMIDTFCLQSSQLALRAGVAVDLDHRSELSAKCRAMVEKAAEIGSYRGLDGREFELPEDHDGQIRPE